MKIAEALSERAELDKMIAQRVHRLKAFARYAEGEEPAEDPAQLLEEILQAMNHREILIAQVNHRNAATYIEHPDPELNGVRMSITEALAFRDRLNAQRNLLNEVADEAGAVGSSGFYGRARRRNELPERTSLPVRELRAFADRTARAHRELDVRIKQSNWDTNL